MKYFLAPLFCFCLLGGAKNNIALAYDVPALTGPVMDTAHMLTPEGAGKIEGAIRQIYAQKVAQIQVVTIPTLGNETIEQVGIEFADKWKIGDKKINDKRTDNGVIILIAAKEKKIRIEVGQGLEGNIPDAIASRIINDVMVPYFKKGHVDYGILVGVLSINQVLTGHDLQPMQLAQDQNNSGNSFSTFLTLIFILLFFFSNPLLALLFGVSASSARSGFGGFGGGGFGGGGGWSGGGGGFSGGGASGGW